jgi:prepilin-type N-terminal cleavage/methylation domain-containing protein
VINKKRVKKRINQAGMTLIEILVAMMIFAFVLGGIVLFGVRAIESSTKSQAMQNTLENARFAIESISKKARTSSGINGGGQEVFFIDNAQEDVSYCYQFTTNGSGVDVLQVGEGTADFSSCSDITTFNELLGESKTDITGSFEVVETDNSVDPKTRGQLKISIKITYEGGLGVQSNSERVIQSTVSLRDY